MSFSNEFSVQANQWKSPQEGKSGIVVANFSPATDKALAELIELLQENYMAVLGSGLRVLIKKNIELQHELKKKETFAQQLVEDHKNQMDKQRVQHENEIEKLRSRLAAEHTRLNLASVEARVENASKYQHALQSVQIQKRSLRILQNISNAHRNKAENLATSLADCKVKLAEMENLNHHLKEELHKQSETSNANFQELLTSRETIGRIRKFHSILLGQRDDRILQLQEKIERLNKASDNDIGKVAPNYYKILGVERYADQNDLKRAFRAKCLMHHPDKHRDSPDQKTHEAIFKTLKYGYEVLNHPVSRTTYDRWLDMEQVRLEHQKCYCSS